jgi:hypothetical protein
MLKADATRVAWFLSLQRILHFPKYYMAPSTHPRIGNRLAGSAHDAISVGLPSNHDGAATSTQPRYSVLASSPSPNRATPSIDGTVTVTAPRFRTEAASGPVSKFSPWQAPANLPPMMGADRATRIYTGAKSPAKRQSLDIPERYRPVASSSYGSFGSVRSIPLAPSHVLSTRQSLRQSENGFAPQPESAGVDQTFLDQHPHLIDDVPLLDQHPSSQYDRRPQEPNGTVGNNQSRHNGSAVSTIHIDGSALGRWTIQHLERALGKPATGMTGVDPRAAIPRSRVAPF